MSSIDTTGFSPVMPDVLRTEYRQVVGGNLLDKPTFGEKFKMALAKVGSFFGRIAGAVLPFFGPLGMAGSAAAYGIQNFSDNAVQKMQAKRQYSAALDAQADSMSGADFWTPGYNPSSVAPMTGGVSTVEVAPFARGMESNIMNTLNNKGAAALDAVNSGSLGASASF